MTILLVSVIGWLQKGLEIMVCLGNITVGADGFYAVGWVLHYGD